MLHEFFYVGMLVLFGIWCVAVVSAIMALDYNFWDHRIGSDSGFVWTILTAPIAPIIAVIEIFLMIKDSKRT